jgi:hypothetical protein
MKWNVITNWHWAERVECTAALETDYSISVKNPEG